MLHINEIRKSKELFAPEFLKKATGAFYTHSSVCDRVISTLKNGIISSTNTTINLIDPFAGDGRLVLKLIKSLPKNIQWNVELWDINDEGLDIAKCGIHSLVKDGYTISFELRLGDAFEIGINYYGIFDVVITNPPWENLKPDSRELGKLSTEQKQTYTKKLKEFDAFLAAQYPVSQPRRKFAGWGTNLSRVGLELCNKLVSPKGQVGIVMPASLLADFQSSSLRVKLFTQFEISNIDYYPSEARLFDNADVNSISLVYKKNSVEKQSISLSIFDQNFNVKEESNFAITLDEFESVNFVLPVSNGTSTIPLFFKLMALYPKWSELEGRFIDQIWCGREVDETNLKTYLSPTDKGLPLFVKGKMIGRFRLTEELSSYYNKEGWMPPKSTDHVRIAWRDVARESQKRRVIATIIPEGTVCGNSTNVVCFNKKNNKVLKVFLAVMNSYCFEFLLRTFLTTGHVSLSAIRNIPMPPLKELENHTCLTSKVEDTKNCDATAMTYIEAYVAKRIFNLSQIEFCAILKSFQKVGDIEKEELLKQYERI